MERVGFEVDLKEFNRVPSADYMERVRWRSSERR